MKVLDLDLGFHNTDGLATRRLAGHHMMGSRYEGLGFHSLKGHRIIPMMAGSMVDTAVMRLPLPNKEVLRLMTGNGIYLQCSMRGDKMQEKI